MPQWLELVLQVFAKNAGDTFHDNTAMKDNHTILDLPYKLLGLTMTDELADCDVLLT